MDYKITFWCGPKKEYLSKERIKEAVNCGFNVLECAYDTETNKQVLKWCEELSVKANVQDPRMGIACAGEPGWEKAVDDIIEDYKAYPALNRFFIKDEPQDAYFPTLARVVKYLHEHDKKHSEYINLLPLPAVPPIETYKKHVEGFIDTVNPKILSYDHYNLMKKEVESLDGCREAWVSYDNRKRNGWENKLFAAYDREGYYDNLEIIKSSANAHNIPWMIIILLVEHWHYRRPNESEIRWEALNALTYGSTELSYFTYWTPGVENTEPWSYHHGMISADGVREEPYYIVQRINRELQTLYKGITEKAPFDNKAPEGFNSKSVYHVGEKEETESLVSYFGGNDVIEEIDTKRAVAGFFGTNRMMITNKDCINPQLITIKSKKELFHLNKATKEWEKVQGPAVLAAGDGELFAWKE